MSKYYRRNVLALIRLAGIDAALRIFRWLFCWHQRSSSIPARPRSILLVSPGHLGDALISTALVRELEARYPEIEKGILCGSWSLPAFETTGVTLRTHVIDHWKLNRSKASLLRKWILHINTLVVALQELRRIRYEVVAVLSAFEPSYIPYVKLSRCKFLAGFTSAGFGPVLDYAVDPEAVSGVHEVQKQASVMKPWLGDVKSRKSYRPLVREPSMDELSLLKGRLKGHGIPWGKVVVIQACSGNPAKEWDLKNWIEVMDWLKINGWHPVLVGKGERDQVTNDALSLHFAGNATNLTNQLSWRDLSIVIRLATLVVGVDSVAGHVCAATDTPFLGVYSGISRIDRWISLGNTVISLTRDVPCSPCHARPCKERPCIMGVTSSQVVAEMTRLLPS